MGQAVRLAQAMRLFDEESCESSDRRESQLLRNMYWLLHTIETAACFLFGLNSTLRHAYLHGMNRTICSYRSEQLTLLEQEPELHRWPDEEHVHMSFYLSHRLWSLSDNVLFSLQLVGRLGVEGHPSSTSDGALHGSITDAYTDFCGGLDDMPSWLRDPDSYHDPNFEADVITSRKRGFWIQRADLLVTFHSLRFLLLKHACDLNLSAFLGATGHQSLIALRQLEIASELVTVASALPHESLRANGQPLVSIPFLEKANLILDNH